MATVISFDDYLDGCSPLTVAQLRLLSEVDNDLFVAIDIATKMALSSMDKEEVDHLMSQYEQKLMH